MLHGAIAERFGLNFTDLKCLDLARHEPELTAGRIAETTGLSTSAVTTVLERYDALMGDYTDEQLEFLLQVIRRINTAAREFTIDLTAERE